jgi:hypothetical protein
VAFSEHDSKRIEALFQKLSDEYDDPTKEPRTKGEDDVSGGQSPLNLERGTRTGSVEEAGVDGRASGSARVPVHEDFLFEVDVFQRELSPVYWMGAVFSIQRGSWFFQEGSSKDDRVSVPSSLHNLISSQALPTPPKEPPLSDLLSRYCETRKVLTSRCSSIAPL